MNKFFIAILVSVLVLAPTATLAQESLPGFSDPAVLERVGPSPENLLYPAPIPKPDALVSCFDTYRFGSVPAVVVPSLERAIQGTTLSFAGGVTNENPYPIPDVKVWAKVFKVSGAEKDVNGPDVVAWIEASDALNVAAGETKPVSFTWDIPADAEPGEYQIATFVTSSDRFELSGLSFTDDVVGRVANFEVLGENLGAVRFAKDSVTVNGRPFRFAAFPPTVPEGVAMVPVTARIENTGAVTHSAVVTWQLHSWDALSDRTRISESRQDIMVPGNGSVDVSFTVEDTAHTVYYLIGTVTSPYGSQSIAGIRFVRTDVDLPRFNFVTGTPGAEGNAGKVVACIHSTNEDAVQNGRVELVAYRAGPLGSFLNSIGIGQLAAATYEGVIPSDIYALEASLEKAADKYIVDARLYKDGALIDHIEIPYCASGECGSDRTTFALMAVIGLLLAISAVLFIRRTRRHDVPVAPTI